MKITLTCPECGRRFTIDHLAADREIERLKKENTIMRTKIAALETMKRGSNDPLDDLMRSMGMK